MNGTKRHLLWALVFVSLFGAGLLIKATINQVPTGTWTSAGNLSAARVGAACVLLADGRLLVTGGDSGSGPVATVDILDTSGNFAAGPVMSFPHSQHTATVLQDGRVLVAGGLGAPGVATSTAEIFDPVANSWTPTGPLMVSRSGHTASLLADGTVLIAGGASNGQTLASLEIFNPAANASAGAFTLSTNMLSSPRENHAAATLADGRVLIIGGWDGTTLPPQTQGGTGAPNVLATTDIFDPSTGLVETGPTLNVARMNHTATAQLDGKVAIIGGSNGQTDLASIEVFDPSALSFTPASSSLSTARQGHLAFLLPHNGNILVVGGTASGAAVAAAELYAPWTGGTSATGAMGSARAGAVGSPLFATIQGNPVGTDGMLMVAGGSDVAGAAQATSEVYGFAWVKTDRADYAPGETVTINGGGWVPGETVAIHLQEVPYFDQPGDLTAVADANGNISNSEFFPDQYDVNTRFYLTATGSVSQAETTFTDSVSVNGATITVENSGCTTAQTEFTQGNTVCASVAVTTNGSGVNATLHVVWFNPSSSIVAADSKSISGSSTVTDTLATTGSSPTGTWTVKTCDASNCSTNGGNKVWDTKTFTLAGPATKYLVTSSSNGPVAGAGVTITAQLADSGGNPVPTSGKIVTWSNTGSGGSFGSPTSTTNSSGVATVTFTTGTTAAITYTVTATDNTSVTGTSGNITTVAGGLDHFKVEASGGGPIGTQTAGTPFNIRVTAQDVNNNTVTSFTSTVLLTSNGTLTGSPLTSGSFAAGVLSSQSVTITSTGSAVTITATGSGKTGTSASFAVNAGALDHFLVEKSGGGAIGTQAAGTAFNIRLTAEDASNNTVTSFTSTVLLTSNGTLTGSPLTSGSFTAGVLDPQSVTITSSGTAVTITATGSGKTGTSASFAVNAGALDHFLVEKSGGGAIGTQTAGTAFNIRVTAQDANNNTVTSFTSTVSLTSNGTLTGSPLTSGSFTAGVLSSQSVTITSTGSAVTITATGSGKTGTSASFTVNAGTIDHFAISAISSPQTAGTPFNIATITAQDANNNTVMSFTSTATFGGTAGVTGTSAAFSAGVLSNASVTPTKAGANLTVTVNDGSGHTGSATIAMVNPGAIDHFAISTISSPQTAGTAFNIATITAQDANNNSVTGFTSAVTYGGTAGVAGTSPAFTAGVLSNASVTPTVAGSNLTVTVNDGSGHTGTATIATVNPGALDHFSFVPISSPQTAGTAFNITITAQDANNNTFTGFNANGDHVALSSTGALTGAPITTPAFTNGVLSNYAVTITNTGTFTITATAGSQGNNKVGTSNSFTVNPGAPTHLVYLQQPTNAQAGAPIAPAVTVQVEDSNNNVVTTGTGSTASVGIAIGTNPGSGTLSGTTPVAAVAGVATFSNLSINRTGNSYTLAASSAGLTGATSSPFNIIPGAPTHLVYLQQPTNAQAGATISPAVTVQVLDVDNNVVTSGTGSTASVGIAIGTNPSSGSLSGTTPVSAVAGVVTFSNLSINNTGTGYTLAASSSGLTGATSNGFNITARSTSATVSLNPASVTTGSPTTVTVTVTDTAGTGASNPGGTVSFTPTGHGSFTGTCTLAQGGNPLGTVSCQVSYTPSDSTSPQNIAATYTPTDSIHSTSNGNASLTVTGTPPSFTSSASTTFTAGMPGSFTVTASGTPTPTLSENPTDTLPSGVGFNAATGLLSGTPTNAGTFTLHFTATNGISPDATQTFTLTVNPGALAIITLSPASQTITAGGSAPYTATGYDQYHNVIGDVTGATTFTVTNGTCTGGSCGSTAAGPQTVTGNDSGFTNTATLNVNPGAITHLVLNPPNASIAAGGSQSYTAAGLDMYNNPAGDVTNSTTFGITPDGSCPGASCTADIADPNGSYHTVTGTYGINGPQGATGLTVNAGTFTQLQLLVPGETAAPGTASGKTGNPNIEYVNGAFNVTVNAVDQYWNLVNTATDTVQITSNDTKAVLPSDGALIAGTGAFSVTLNTVSNPATTTITATDATDDTKTASTSPAIEVIVVYTVSISPTDWATGQQATYTLTVNNADTPNTNSLASVEISVPSADQGSITNVAVIAAQKGGAAANWSYDASKLPGAMRFYENTANDAVLPGGTITITFNATSSATVASDPVAETWNTTAYSDIASQNPLPLAPPEPTVSIGAAPAITSANSTNAFTYGTAGTTFTVTTTGVPTPSLSETGSFPAWATFTDNHDGTATISGTPTAAGPSTFTITAHNGYGNDAKQDFTLTVNKATVTPGITADDKTYNGTNTATIHCTLASVLAGDTGNVSCTGTGTFASASAGTWTVTSSDLTLSGSAAGNYMLSTTTATTTAKINPKPVTATLTAGNKTYDRTSTEPNASMSCSLDGVLTGDTSNVSCAASNGTFDGSNVGSHTVTATVTISGPAAGNYTLGAAGTSTASTTATASASITTAPVTATLSAGNRTYNRTSAEPDANMSCNLGGVLSGDTVTCTPTAGTFDGPNVGSHTVSATVTLGGASASNYTLGAAGTNTTSTTATASASITTAPVTATLSAGNRTYDRTSAEPDANMSCTLGGVLSGDTVTCTPTAGTFDGPNVGSHTVTATVTLGGISATNYTLGTAGTTLTSTSTTASASITTLAITATLTASNKTFDGNKLESEANMSCSLGGVLSGDTVTCTPTTGTFDGPNAGSHTVTATVTLGGVLATNYTLGTPGTSLTSISASASASITPAPTSTTVISSLNPSTYGQAVTFTALVTNTATGSPAVPTGTVTFTIDGGTAVAGTLSICPSAIPANRLCAAYSTSALTVTGSPHGVTATYTNADLNFVSSGGTLSGGQSVNPAPLTIKANDYVGKVYGTALSFAGTEFSITSGTLYNGDTVTGVSLFSVGAASGANVANYDIVPSNAVGTRLANYAISYTNGMLTVVQATTATTVVSSLNPSNWGDAVTWTATVINSSNGYGTPTGTVTFYNAAAGATCALPGSSTVLASAQPLSAAGQASTSTNWLPVGTDNILACYSGDTNFWASGVNGSTPGTLTQTVIAAPLATLGPPDLSFGNQQAGTVSGAQTVTLSNSFNGYNGTAPLNLSITFTGTTPTWFKETDTCGSSINAGGSCTINVKFAPPLNTTGAGSGFLSVTDNSGNVMGTMQMTSLTGAGLTTINDQSLYTDAIFATASNCGSITLSGGSTVDSFNSALGGYLASDPKTGGNVGTNGNVTLNGSKSAIYGTAYVPSTASGSCNKTSVTGLTASGGAQVTGGMQQLSGPINYPAPPAPTPAPPTTNQNISGSCPSGMTGCANLANKSVSLAAGQYGNVNASGGTTVHVSKGTYNVNSLTLSGKSILYVDSGPVVINLAGASLSGSGQVIDLSGGSIQNQVAKPSNLQFTYGGSRGINLSGGSGSYATVYAPNALINMSGGSDFYGSIVGSTVTGSGGTSFHYDANLPDIRQGNSIYFNAEVNNVNLNGNTNQVKLYMTNSSVSFAPISGACPVGTAGDDPASPTVCTLMVPNAVTVFNSASLKSGASTSYDTTNNRWVTNVSKSAMTGNTFLTGVTFQVPIDLPTGIQNVSWSAAFSTDTQGISFQWHWGAAVYTSFGSYGALGVNPVDGSANLHPPDPAGTPESYKQFVTFGGTGGGLASYTGYPSTNSGIVPTIAPMSVSPSSDDAGTVAVNSPYAMGPYVLTNNSAVSHSIYSISIVGANSGDFVLASGTNNCVGMSSLASGASCNLYVTFTPSTNGGTSESAKIVINDDANNSPQTVYLTGTGD